jgi:hypothetical protein
VPIFYFNFWDHRPTSQTRTGSSWPTWMPYASGPWMPRARSWRMARRKEMIGPDGASDIKDSTDQTVMTMPFSATSPAREA